MSAALVGISHDFATLYTKLSHDDILQSMGFVIDLAFKKSKYEFISEYDTSGSWSNKTRPGTFKFDAESLKKLTEVYFGSLVFLC